MTALSKLTSSLNYNCYEIAHPWTTSCSHSWSYLFASCVQESGKIYAALYLFAQLVLARKISPDAFLQTLRSATRSTAFLSYNVFFFLFFICTLRKLTPRLYLQQTVFSSGFLSSLLAVFIEKPNRRKMLSLYMLNIFSEILFNFMLRRRMIRSVPYGDVLLFAVGLAGHTSLLPVLHGNDPISKAVKFLIGGQEFRPAAAKECSHRQSCMQYGVTGFVKPFLVGYMGRFLLSALAGNPLKLIRNPSRLLVVLLDGSNTRQGVCLGGMAATFRLVQCVLRNRNIDDRLSRGIAGFLAALWINAARNRSLSLYVFWKAVETYYLIGQSRKLLPSIPLSRELIYALSCGFMLFNAVLEPHNLRGSYLKFLNNITGEALSKVNRHPIAILGFDSTKCWPNYFPYDVDLAHISKSFLEQVVVWS